MSLGIAKDDEERIACGIRYIIANQSNRGDTYVPEENMYTYAADLLEAGREQVDDAVTMMTFEGSVMMVWPAVLAVILGGTYVCGLLRLAATGRYAFICTAVVGTLILIMYGKLKDKFGDNGVVSLVVGKRENDTLHIILWLMSCRVLKRKMECAMMDSLVKKARAAGVRKIIGYYLPTAKNKMVKEFYQQQGFSMESCDDTGKSVWSCRYRVRRR